MAMKAKAKSKSMKKPVRRASAAVKSVRLKPKTAKRAAVAGSRNGSKPASKASAMRSSKATKVESKRTSTAVATASARAATQERVRSKHFDNAIQAYEAGIKLMHSEEFVKAIRCFDDLITEYVGEPEIQGRAKVLLHACEKRIQERGRAVLRSAEDYYNVGIGKLNQRALDAAIEHLQHALKLAPKSDHILYALATANALKGDRDQALEYLKQSIHYRGENRFLAARDEDWESLQEDADFRQLVTPSEK